MMRRAALTRLLVLTAVPFVLLARTAAALPITYFFSGTGSGTLGGVVFTDRTFLTTILANTDDVAFQASLGAFGILGLGGQIAIDGQPATTFNAPLFVFGANGSDAIGFGNFTQGNLITTFDGGLGLAAYDLRSNFGPIVATNVALNQFHDVATSGGVLTFDQMSQFTFSASTVASVPEPTAVLLVATGLLGVWGARRRAGGQRA